jgi:hypothetical protein
VSAPNWISSPVAAELEDVVGAFRDAGTVAKHVTLTRLLDSWSGLVVAVERGYEESIYEYANDVDSRAMLDRVGNDASSEAKEALFRWLGPWDERSRIAHDRSCR